ncbi:MAG: aminomethyltransferase family protein [Nitrospira sp.]|nr:aminomethyltransferase family protein [Nitrospira sp.]
MGVWECGRLAHTPTLSHSHTPIFFFNMVKRTPLYEVHKSLGAAFREYRGWELPEKFTDIAEEYQAVRDHVGLMDLSFRGKIQLAGPDRAQFLHGMVTQDIQGMGNGSGAYAVMLTAKGHMVADMNVYNMGDWLFLDVEPDLKNKILETLDKYLFVNATLTDVTDQYGLLSLQGAQSEALLSAVLSEPVTLEAEHQHIQRCLAGVEVSVIRTSYTGETGFELLVSQDQTRAVWNTLMEGKSKDGATPPPPKPVGMAVLDILRVEAGIPRYGVDMDENNLPLEAAIEERAISYTKGCYIGQEVVARMKYRGQANRLLMGFQFQGEEVPPKGAKIWKEGKELGWVTSAVFSPGFKKPIALGYVHRNSAQPGTSVSVETAHGPLGGEVVSLPFYKKL